MSFDLEQIRQLMQELEASSLRELHVQDGEFNLFLSKNEQTSTTVTSGPVVESANTPSEVTENPLAKPQPNTVNIVAPLVGTVYLQPKPDAPAFKQVGDRVTVGETVAIIEAMKLMTDVTSQVAGTIVEVLVESEEVVDYDKPLYRVELD
jgi:acetyl-CoA carboxylase biotin carboxyl carrier protein